MRRGEALGLTLPTPSSKQPRLGGEHCPFTFACAFTRQCAVTLVNMCEHMGSRAHAYGHSRGCAHTRGSHWPEIRLERRGCVQSWTSGSRLPHEADAPLASFLFHRCRAGVGALFVLRPPSERRRAPHLTSPFLGGTAAPSPPPPGSRRSLPPSLGTPPFQARSLLLAPRVPSLCRGTAWTPGGSWRGSRSGRPATAQLAVAGPARRSWRWRVQPGSVRSPHPRSPGPSLHAGLRAVCVSIACGLQPWPRPQPQSRALPASTSAPPAEAAEALGRLWTQNQVCGASVASPERSSTSACRVHSLLLLHSGA